MRLPIPGPQPSDDQLLLKAVANYILAVEGWPEPDGSTPVVFVADQIDRAAAQRRAEA